TRTVDRSSIPDAAQAVDRLACGSRFREVSGAPRGRLAHPDGTRTVGQSFLIGPRRGISDRPATAAGPPVSPPAASHLIPRPTPQLAPPPPAQPAAADLPDPSPALLMKLHKRTDALDALFADFGNG